MSIADLSIADQFRQYAKSSRPAPPKPTRTGKVCLSLHGPGCKQRSKSGSLPLRLFQVRGARKELAMSKGARYVY